MASVSLDHSSAVILSWLTSSSIRSPILPRRVTVGADAMCSAIVSASDCDCSAGASSPIAIGISAGRPYRFFASQAADRSAYIIRSRPPVAFLRPSLPSTSLVR